MGLFDSRDVFYGTYFEKQYSSIIPVALNWDGRNLEVELCEVILEMFPDDTKLLSCLGHLYTDIGEYAKGLEIDLRLSELQPDDALVLYNLACSHSLLNRADEAINALKRAVDNGYDDAEYMSSDKDLDNIRATEGYNLLVLHILSARKKKKDSSQKKA